MKISSKVQSFLETLPGLTDDELRQVHALSAYHLKKKPKRTQVEEEFFEALVVAFKGQKVYVPHDWLDQPKNTHTPTWNRHVQALGPLLAAFKVTPGTPLAHGTYRLLWGLLLEDLAGKGIPISLGTVINNMGRLPEVIDDAFPNYIMSGLAPMIPKAMSRGNT